MIALLLLHKLNGHDPTHPKQETGLLTTGATLIITPSAILQQWESELKLHAPSLKVTTYRGIKASKGNAESPENLSEFDVVLTDYKVSRLHEGLKCMKSNPMVLIGPSRRDLSCSCTTQSTEKTWYVCVGGFLCCASRSLLTCSISCKISSGT